VILLDSNVLVALVDPRDGLHPRAVQDLKRLVRRPLLVSVPVLTETCFLLTQPHHRARLRDLLRALDVRPCVPTNEAAFWDEVFLWLARYAEHDPDWTDGYLVALASQDSHMKIWTYDSEFYAVWRKRSGARLAMAVPLK
jgi:predicted nucleic acid-binding protein